MKIRSLLSLLLLFVVGYVKSQSSNGMFQRFLNANTVGQSAVITEGNRPKSLKVTDGVVYAFNVIVPNIYNSNNTDVYLVKTDHLGEIIWERKYGSEDKIEVIKSLTLNSDGGYLLLIRNNDDETVLVKTDNLGQVSTTNSSTFEKIVLSKNATPTLFIGEIAFETKNSGNIIIAGSENVGLGVSPYPRIICLNSTATSFVWNKLYKDVWGYLHGTALSAYYEFDDNSIIFTGFQSKITNNMLSILKIDKNGELIFSKGYGSYGITGVEFSFEANFSSELERNPINGEFIWGIETRRNSFIGVSVISFNSDGVLISDKFVQPSYSDTHFSNLAISGDKIGLTFHYIATPVNSTLVITDLSINPLFQRNFGSQGNHRVISEIEPDENNLGFLLTGEASYSTAYDYNPWILKTNPFGQSVNSSNLDNGCQDWINDEVLTFDALVMMIYDLSQFDPDNPDDIIDYDVANYSATNINTMENVSYDENDNCITNCALASPTLTLSCDVNGICNGESYTISAPDGYTNYMWSTGELTQEITVSDMGTYSVIVADATGCWVESSIDIQPTVPIVYNYTAPIGTHTWATGATGTNPFGTSSTVIVRGKITIPAKSDITIQGMTFKFEENASVEVLANNFSSNFNGGVLTLKNSKFTAAQCCDTKKMWQGVVVKGSNVTNLNSQIKDAAGIIRNGRISFFNSTLEHAEVGVYLPKGGGIINATNSTFADNMTDVKFEAFTNFNPLNSSIKKDNVSFFRTCTFITNNKLLTDGFNPVAHIWMDNVYGIKFHGCTFRYAAGSDYTDINEFGHGILAYSSGFHLLGDGMVVGGGAQTKTKFIGLNYGIEVRNINSVAVVKASEVQFTNNHRGAYMVNCSNPILINSTFTIGNSISPVDSAYGLYLHGSTGYIVEDNWFKPNSSSTTNVMVGAVVNRSGAGANEIYRNRFDDLMEGTLVLRKNDDGADNGEQDDEELYGGLELLCNKYNNNEYHISVIDGNLSDQQGYCNGLSTLTPANNIFTHNCPTADGKSDFLLQGTTHKVFYHRYSDISTKLVCYSDNQNSNYPDPYIVDQNNVCGSGFIYEAGCPIVNGITYTKIKGDKLPLIAGIIEGQSQINGGNTSLLLDMIGQNMPAGVVQQALIDASPYLTDEVLIAAIKGKSTPLPNGILEQILLANSPLSEKVMAELQNRTPSLTKGTLKTLQSAQIGTSAMYELQKKIAFYESRNDYLTSKLIGMYLTDTIIPNPLDSVKALLVKEESYGYTEHRRCYKAEVHLTAEEYILMEEEIQRQHPDGQLDNYCKLMLLFSELKQQGKDFEEVHNNQALKEEIERIANDPSEKTRLRAASLLKKEFNRETKELVMVPEQLSIASARMFNDSKESIKGEIKLIDSGFRLFPNPASGKLNVEYETQENGNYTIELVNTMGQLIYKTNLNGKSGIDVLDVGELSPSLYIVKISKDSQLIYYERVQVVR